MPDFLGMMKQAAQLQSKMQAMQEKMQSLAGGLGLPPGLLGGLGS